MISAFVWTPNAEIGMKAQQSARVRGYETRKHGNLQGLVPKVQLLRLRSCCLLRAGRRFSAESGSDIDAQRDTLHIEFLPATIRGSRSFIMEFVPQFHQMGTPNRGQPYSPTIATRVRPGGSHGFSEPSE